MTSIQESMSSWVALSLASKGALASEADSDPRPVVRYRNVAGASIEVGRPAIVYPIGHNSPFVSGYVDVITTTVLAYDKPTGAFETKNTRYVLDTSVLH
jgi:hypothetical protein